MGQLILPRTDKDGRSYISYSQVNLWNDLKGFNTGGLGTHEYIRSYFLGEDWPEMGWGTFGSEVEDYICERKHADNFDAEEKAVLDTIEPIGVFQKEIKIEFDDFYLLGYIDDCNEELSHIRDFKTASLNSSKKYYKDDYYQLDIYAMYAKQVTGKLPEKLEVCIIEREGNCFRGGGRSVLRVKENVWYHERETNEERQAFLRDYIIRTAHEISAHYIAFLKLTGQEVPKRELVTV